MSILAVLFVLTILSLVGVWACLRTPALRRRAALGYAFALAAALFVSLPASVVVTWSISPFWNWLGDLLGTRLVNHGGPVLWCYVVVLVACAALLSTAGMLFVRLWLTRDSASERDEAA